MTDEESVKNICNELLVSDKVVKKAIQIMKIDFKHYNDKCPKCGHIIKRRSPRRKTTIAASIYLATRDCGEWRTQAEIQEITNVAPVTLRKRLRQILKHSEFKKIGVV